MRRASKRVLITVVRQLGPFAIWKIAELTEDLCWGFEFIKYGSQDAVGAASLVDEYPSMHSVEWLGVALQLTPFDTKLLPDPQFTMSDRPDVSSKAGLTRAHSRRSAHWRWEASMMNSRPSFMA